MAAIAYADISTGEFYTCEVTQQQLLTTLEMIQPAEILISKQQRTAIESLLQPLSYNPAMTRLEEWLFEESFARETLLRQVITAGVVLHYFYETQRGMVEHIRSIRLYDPSEYMSLDFATRRNLEIFYTFDGSRQGTLFQILDKTLTPMGGRLFKKWLSAPLRRLKPIQQRLEAVDALFHSADARRQLQEILQSIGDMERILSRIAANRAIPRDYVLLSHTLNIIPNERS